MNQPTKFLLPILIAIAAFACSKQERTTGEYRWRNVAIGGGGYVTGVVVHPTEKDLLYIRTDVGGAYRWDAKNDRMIPLTDWISFDESNLYGVDGIALAPSNPDIVYLACGKTQRSEPHAVLKSTDRGKTWTRTTLAKKAMANGPLRWAGECIAVDPLNESVVYCGTRFDGLWKTTDGGAVWSRVDSVPSGSEGNGIRTVLFDSNPTKEGVTQTVYVSVYDVGVYRTRDAGRTWNLLQNGPAQPIRMAVDPNGVLYATSKRGVFRYKDERWTDISPVKNKEYSAISVCPSNPNTVLCAERFNGFFNPIYLSRDGGETWRNVLENDERHFQVPWWPKRHFSSSTACAIFDPHDSNRVWYSDWYGTWSTPDITQKPCRWFTHEKGHEEMVVFGMISPTKGAPLLTAIADNNGTRHTQFDAFPQTRFGVPLVQSTTGLDFCEADPNVVVRVGSKNDGTGGVGALSTDNGVTWNAFPKTSFEMNGRVAVSAADPKRIVVLPVGDAPKYTTDGGQTWNESQGAPRGGVGKFWHKANPLASDRVNGSRFYYFEGGDLYRSDDGGATWRRTASLPREHKGFLATVAAAPYREGEIWIGLGRNGLFRSSDAGDSFEKLSNISWSRSISFGKPFPGTKTPTLFVYGTIDGVQGVFRSIDMGQTWKRINNDSQPIGDSPECMTGDRQVFGRVFIGTNGRGIFMGELR